MKSPAPSGENDDERQSRPESDASESDAARKGSEATTVTRAPDDDAVAASVIGPYRLIQPIGEGGMGEVWLAEQMHPLRRRVALKLLRAGMQTREFAARFDAERQALALMDHPAIAKIFDAGVSAEGRPYFVMEYVPGIPITAFCDKRKLNVRERLELFVRVCEGVQHAHQKAIIHRDLKPSNILVTEVDGRPLPKIIDFGVAKAIGQRLSVDTMFTVAGTIIGTPEYMSPEQTAAFREDIDTRSDVYSLGIILYEALVGALPRDYRKVAFDEVLRSIREDDAPRPSTKLGTLGADSTEIANKRRTEPRTLTRELRGDLDSITLKCIEKDRNRRYGAPADIAADIGRYLRNEPVTAAPAGVAYRAQKFVARHRLGVAAATTIILLAVAFAIAEAVQLRRITRERDRSDRVAQFMRDMFLVSEPFYATRGTNIPASEILDKASREIDLEIKDDSELRARLLRDLGIVYSNLGFDSRAKELLRRAVDLDTGALGPKHRETLRSATALASVMANAPNSNTAENMLRGALAAQESQFGRNDPDTLYTMEALARDLLIHKRLGEAEQFGREALDRSGRVFGRDDRRTWSARWRLFNVLSAERKEAEAAQFGQESLDDAARLFGKDDPQTLTCARLVGRLFMRQQKYAQAEAAARQAVEIDRKSSSTDFLRFGDAAMLASALSNQGKYAEAKQITEDLLSQERAASGDTNSDVAVAMYNLACYSARLGHSEEALSWLKQSVAHGLPPIGLAQMQKDPDLESLRQDARFAALVKAAGAP